MHGFIEDLRRFTVFLSRLRSAKLLASWWRTRAGSATGRRLQTGLISPILLMYTVMILTSRKGILGNVSLGGEVVTGWRMTGLPLDDGPQLLRHAERVGEDTRRNRGYKQFLRCDMETHPLMKCIHDVATKLWSLRAG